MRRRYLSFVFVLIAISGLGGAAEIDQLTGVAFSEKPSENMQLQIWQLGNPAGETTRHEITAGVQFAVPIDPAILPVEVEITAEGHVALAFTVVHPMQFALPPAWLRSGQPTVVKVANASDPDTPPLVWGHLEIGPWSSDQHRWQAAIPRTRAQRFTIWAPEEGSRAEVLAVAENGQWAHEENAAVTTGRALKLNLVDTRQTIRVIDQRGDPVVGAIVAEARSPGAGAQTDENGQATLFIPKRGAWEIFARAPVGAARRIGSDRPKIVTIEITELEEVELRWPEELEPIIVHPQWLPPELGGFPRVVSDDAKTFPFFGNPGRCAYWGPSVVAGSTEIRSAGSPVVLSPLRSCSLEGRVVGNGDRGLPGMPIWVQIPAPWVIANQSTMLGSQMELERPWLPWGVSDENGAFSIAALPTHALIAECRTPGRPPARSERLHGEAGATITTVLRIEEGVEIRLRTVDPSGEAIPGVAVAVHRAEEKRKDGVMVFHFGNDAPPPDPDADSVSNEDGHVLITAAPTGLVNLTLDCRGWVAHRLDEIDVGPEGLDLGEITLQESVDLVGATVDEKGTAIGNAEVALSRDPQMPFFTPETTSDGDGRFEIRDLEGDADVYLQARAEGLVAKAPLKVALPKSGTATTEVEMAAEKILRGVVLEASNERPISGASLNLRAQLEIQSGGMNIMTMSSAGDCETDPEGRFEIDGLSAGTYELEVAAAGFRSHTIPVAIADNESPQPQYIHLEKGKTIRGWVFDYNGEPAPGIRVNARPSSQSTGFGSSPESTTSETDGRFFFDVLGEGAYRLTAADDQGHQASQIAQAGQIEEVELRLEQGLTISGFISDPDEYPVQGATVNAFSPELSSIAEATESDASGHFELADVSPGQWTLFVSSDGYANTSKKVQVIEGKGAQVDITLKPGAAVVGTVTGLSSSELDSCRIRGGGSSTTPRSDGSFRLDNTTPGEQTITAMIALGTRSRSVTVTVPEQGESEPVTIDFESGITVDGTVRRAGFGVPGLVVAINQVGGRGGSTTLSGSDGEWVLKGLEEGEYEVAVRNKSGETLAGDHVLLQADLTLDLDLEAGSIYGRLLDSESGRPIEHATVTVSRSGVPPITRVASSDAAGAFAIEELADGDYTVLAEASGHLPGRETATLSEGQSQEVTLELEAEDHLVLLIQEPDGAPASSIHLTTMSAGVLGPELNVSCDTQGRCELRNLPRGIWTALITGRGMALMRLQFPGQEQQLRLQPSGQLHISAAPAEDGTTWRIRIVDADRGLVVPLSSWWNVARAEWVPVADTGLHIDLPTGSYRIEAYSPSGELSSQIVTIRPGGDTNTTLEAQRQP